MAFNAGAVTASLQLEAGLFIAALRAAAKELSGFTAQAKKAGVGTKSFLGDLLKFEAIKAVVKGAFHVMKASVESVLEVFGKANEAFDSFELSVQRLEVALRLRGMSKFKQEFLDLAETLQDTTQFSRNAVIGLEAIAVNAGVAGKDVAAFTSAATSLAQVAGIDLNNAGKQLARTLSGGIGRSITQVLPEVNNMTKAMRESGGIIDLINDRLGGTAQALAETSDVLGKRFTNSVTEAFANLGETFNPIVDVFLQQGIKFATAIGQGIKNNSQKITDAFGAVIGGALDKVPSLIDAAFDFVSVSAEAYAFSVDLAGWFGLTFKNVLISVLDLKKNILSLVAETRATFAGQLLSPEQIGGLSSFQAFEETAAQLAIAKQEAKGLEAAMIANSAAARSTADGVIAVAEAARDGVGPLGEAATFLKDSAKSAGDAVAAMTTAGQDATRMVTSYNLIKNSAGVWVKELISGLQTQKQIAEATDDAGSAQKRVNKHAFDAQAAVDALKKGILEEAYNFDVAKEAAKGVTDEVRRTRDAVDSVNSAQQSGSGGGGGASAGGAFGTGGAGDAFGRHSGGSLGLDTSSADATRGTLNAFNSFAAKGGGGAARDSNAFLYQQIAGKLRAQMKEESAAFAQGIIGELAQQGIWDPSARDSFLRQRYEEARRLGTLPRGATYAGSR